MPKESLSKESLSDVRISSAKIPTSLLLSLGTIPVLAFLLGSKAVLQAMREIGEASEEIFRGDRLPILEVSDLEKESDSVHFGSDR